ncbi:MAG: 6-pyruvoyl-tetrahydropterin synthase-related protein [Dehalococcoidia bacterium]|nr:6-pyruvoyl-tetrahydropterin synthase-related protein [Dehalococcoidia bacterium]
MTVLLAAGIGLIAAVPFFLPGFPAARDSLSHLFRVWAVEAAVAGGTLYPRWLGDFVYGYGYPLFNFYGPLLYALALLPAYLGADAMLALRFAVILSVAAAAVGAALLARDLVGSAGGVVAAAVYVAAPYVQTDLLVRGAFPEVLGIALLPWALLAVQRDRPVWLAVAVALLVLAHNGAALIGLPLVAGFLLWRAGGARRLSPLRRGGAGVGIGLLLSAWFWLPATIELEAVWLGTPEGRTDFLAALAPFDQLVQFSFLHDYREVPGAFLPAGLVQVLLALAGLPFALRRGGALFAIVLVLTAVLMTPLAAPLWERLPIVTLMAFPWRLQAVVALACAVLAAGIPSLSRRRALRLALAAAATIAALVAGLAGARPTFLDIAPHAIDSGGFAAFERWSGFIGTTSPVQFRPRSVAIDPARLPEPAAEPAPRDPVPEVAFLSDGRLRVRSDSATTLRVRQFFFPGWSARADGMPLPISADGPAGVIAVALPPGETTLALTFGPTGPRFAGALASAVGLAAAVALGMRPRRRGLLLSLAVLVAGLAVALRLPDQPAWTGLRPASGDAGPLSLLGVGVNEDRVPLDGVLTVRALWQTREPLGPDWEAVVALEQVESGVVTKVARAPRAGTVSSGRWRAGDLVEDVQWLTVPPSATAQPYRLWLGWRAPDRETPLLPAGEGWLPPSPLRAPSLPFVAGGRFEGGVTLLAGQATPVAALPLGLTLPWPGTLADLGGRGALDVRLLWQADTPLQEDYGIFVTVRHGAQVITQTNTFPPLDQRYTSLWPVGRPVEQRYLLPLPALPEGPIEVTAGLFRRDTLVRLRTVEGADQAVVARLRREAAPPALRVDQPIGAALLLGYDRHDGCGTIISPPCTIELRLVWAARQPIAEPLTVFLHLVGPAGQLVSQQDGPPNDGIEPTDRWGGERVGDRRRLVLPADAPPGDYRILVGLYRADGSRVPAADGDSVELFRVRVVR